MFANLRKCNWNFANPMIPTIITSGKNDFCAIPFCKHTREDLRFYFSLVWIPSEEDNALYKKRILEANARSIAKKKELLRNVGIDSNSKLKLIIVDELKSLRDKWSSINENHPSMPVGFNIIDQLLATKNL
jgi:hypothetical protein